MKNTNQTKSKQHRRKL